MADVFTRYGYNGTSWAIEIGSSDYIGFYGVNFLNGISPGAFNRSTHKTVALPTDSGDDLCTTNHIRNTRYVSAASQSDPGQVNLHEAGSDVDLTTSNVSQTDCTLRVSYQDDTPADTTLENCNFFAYDPSQGPTYAPTGVLVVAAEHDGSDIQTTRESDSGVAGGAWDSTKGVGGSANALIMSDQSSAATHYFYILVSMSPTSNGLKSGRLRVEFDVT